MSAAARHLALLALGALAGACATESAPPTRAEALVRFYADKVAGSPENWAAHGLLGAAHLDRARETHDPAEVAAARAALERSLELQPNFQALYTMTAVCAFAHRFEEALEWGERAAAAAPARSDVLTLLVEANLGLGRLADAEELLDEVAAEPVGFHTAAARGHWLKASGRVDEAAHAFAEAAALALAVDRDELAEWAQVLTAACFLDSGRHAEASPHLAAARALVPDDPVLRTHEAEFLEAEGRDEEALATYVALAQETDDPSLHARVFGVARRLGRTELAESAFTAAERGYRRVVDAGEIYTLGALARLYADAERNLEEAAELARRNLEFKRDAEARETLERIEALSGARPTSGR